MLALPPPPGAASPPQKPAALATLTEIVPHHQPPPPPHKRRLAAEKTHPFIWCAAILCLIFSLLLIFFGIATLIVYFAIKPRNPMFDTPNARLITLFFDSEGYFNGDFVLAANFSNPNKKIDLTFEYLDFQLYFHDRLIAAQVTQPFSERRGEVKLELVRLSSSLMYLPQNVAMELRRQVLSNRIQYAIRGTFKVRASLGVIHFSYWLHSFCQLEISGPPTGGLVSHSCITKK